MCPESSNWGNVKAISYESVFGSLEGSYEAGLAFWLKGQGVEGIKPHDISHPEALRAFNAALSGQVLAMYEPKPIREVETFTKDDSFREFFKFDLDSLETTIDLSKISVPLDTLAHGRRGYALGKAARMLKQEN